MDFVVRLKTYGFRPTGSHHILLDIVYPERCIGPLAPHQILQKRLKNVYSHLSSGVRARVNAALALLAAVAARSRASCAETLNTLDFTLAALPKIASSPKHAQVRRCGGQSGEQGLVHVKRDPRLVRRFARVPTFQALTWTEMTAIIFIKG